MGTGQQETPEPFAPKSCAPKSCRLLFTKSQEIHICPNLAVARQHSVGNLLTKTMRYVDLRPDSSKLACHRFLQASCSPPICPTYLRWSQCLNSVGHNNRSPDQRTLPHPKWATIKQELAIKQLVCLISTPPASTSLQYLTDRQRVPQAVFADSGSPPRCVGCR